MLEVETLGDETMEYSISAYLSTLAKTAAGEEFCELFRWKRNRRTFDQKRTSHR